MTVEYNVWRTCDLCGHEGFCRPASTEEICLYEAEDVCQRCDGEGLRDNIISELESLLKQALPWLQHYEDCHGTPEEVTLLARIIEERLK